jgi:hypothetical protein
VQGEVAQRLSAVELKLLGVGGKSVLDEGENGSYA